MDTAGKPWREEGRKEERKEGRKELSPELASMAEEDDMCIVKSPTPRPTIT
jgi:hypothetical protein